ncbi:MAG TPA: M20/M25/M40 family metallo-hydrolase [Candidatus Saccharimonadales bacterium]|nr:M20/M25/M40 family metallo-hydrolase [Candidatus Saccharimonadales bacterium]
MTNQLIDKIKQLIAIESTADNPKGLRQAYDFMVDFIKSSGKTITIEPFERNGKSSFLAYRAKTRPKQFDLIFNGHVDVVPGEAQQYKALVKDNKLYGRGVYDMKAAAVIMADIFCQFIDKIPFSLALQIVTDEESGGKNGTKLQVVEHGVRADFVIAGDCGRATDTYEIANRAKGAILVEIGFQGQSAHGAYPWRGENAAIKAHRFIQEIHTHYPTPSEHTEASTVTVTGITTKETAHNKTPGAAVVKLDARYTIGDPNLSDRKKFAAFIKNLDPSAEILTFHDFSPPYYADPKNPSLLRLKAAAEMVEGQEFDLVQRNGSSDARFYGVVGNQACEFGVAGEHQHADNEYVPVKALDDYRETLQRFLQAYL